MTSRSTRTATRLACGLLVCAIALALQRPVALSSQAPAAAVTVRLVVVGSADEAARIAARALAGENMAALARTYSTDPTAPDGGLLGPLDPATLRPELRDALRGLRPGQITPVVRIATGFAVLQIVDDPGRVVTAAPVTPMAGVSAIGSVKYVLNVAGLNESDVAADAWPKAEGWNRDPRQVCEARRRGVDAAVARLETALRPGTTAVRLPPADEMQVHCALGQLYAYDGRMDAAIAQFEAARAMVATVTSPDDPLALQLDEMLGVAWLHKAEMDNDVYRRPGGQCL